MRISISAKKYVTVRLIILLSLFILVVVTQQETTRGDVGLPGFAARLAQPCLPNDRLPSSPLPFSQIHSVSAPNANGDHLVVGQTTIQQVFSFPLAATTNQQFCQPLRLASNLLATAYVPTQNERNGDFSSFAGLLIDPLANLPFPGGIIPANRVGGIYAWRIRANSLAAVSAASYRGTTLARESIVAAFGNALATTTQAALTTPLPTTLAGTTVTVRDRLHTQRDAPLFFVSPNQINYQVPAGTVDEAATIVVISGGGEVAVGTVQIAAVAPGLFAANADGQGVAAAVALRAKADGSQTFEPVVRFDTTQNRFVAVPIDLGPESDQVFLVLFGSGLRFRSSLATVSARIGGTDAPVSFAGAQGDFAGLDQINVKLPRSLAGRGNVEVAVTIDGQMTNSLQINVR